MLTVHLLHYRFNRIMERYKKWTYIIDDKKYENIEREK